MRAKIELSASALAKITEKNGKYAKICSFFLYKRPLCRKDTEKLKFFLRNSLISVAKWNN